MEKQSKMWNLPFVLLLIASAVNTINGYMINPVFSQYLISNGIDFIYTGSISSLLSWMALAFRPFWGAKCDSADLKKLAMVAYGGIAISVLSYNFVHSMALIIVARIIHGIFFGLSSTLSVAFAIKYVPQDRIAEGVSYIGVASLLGNLIGPQFGSMISDSYGISALFITCFIMGLLCMILTAFVPYTREIKEYVKKSKSFDDYFEKKLIVYVILIGIFSIGNGIISYYLKPMGELRNISNISLFFTVYALVLVVIKPFVGKLQDKVGLKLILYPAYIFYAIGVIILANSYSLIPVLIAAVFKAIGQGSGTPAIQAEAIKKIGTERSGVASSTVMIGQDLGNAIGPIYASTVIPTIGYTNMYVIYVGLLILAIVIYYVYNKKEEGKNGIC